MQNADKLAVEVGRRVKEAAKRKKLLQEDLAGCLCVSVSVIRKIYQGYRILTQDEASALAELLGVRKEYLLCIDSDKTEEERNRRLFAESAESAFQNSSFINYWLRESCNAAGFKFQNMVLDAVAFNDEVIETAAFNSDFMYRIKTSEIQSVDLSRADVNAWFDSCIQYAAFTINLLLKQKLADEGKNDEV